MMRYWWVIVVIVLMLLAQAFGEVGLASWYSVRSNGGTKTASGVVFSDHKFTAAHKTLPFHTKVLVSNQKNGKTVEVTITDRGPYKTNRIIDLSPKAFNAIADPRRGIVPVEVLVIPEKPKNPERKLPACIRNFLNWLRP